MITPIQMIEEINRIKTSVEQIEIKGAANANYVLYACQKCDALTNAIEEVIRTTEEKRKNQNDGVEAGEL